MYILNRILIDKQPVCGELYQEVKKTYIRILV